MKKIIISLSALLILLGAIGQAKNGAIKVNPIGLAFGVVNVAYEKALTESSSGQLGIGIVSLDIGSTSISGFGITPEYRIYTNQAIEGFYIAPFLGFASVTAKESSDEAKVTAFGGGVKLGWNWLLGKQDSFVIDLGLGAQYFNANVEVTSGSSDALDLGNFEGLGPVIELAIGYAFD